ncbi:MAG: aminopeptidase P family protein [Rhodospirillales bacterium]
MDTSIAPSAAQDSAGRLKAFRAELTRQKLDGFIVLHSDEHQGEYLPPRAERLAWLTGFTGSAGLAIVLAKEAAIFVDGRYTLQVRDQCDGRLYMFQHVSDEPPAAWIKDHLPKKARLGFDPWLMTPGQVNRFRAASEKAGGALVAVKTNPIDAVWSDQPAAPISPAFVHEARFAGKPSREKRRAVAKTLERDSIDAAVLSAPDSICWLLNIRGGDVPYSPLVLCFAVLHADATLDLFIDSRKLTPAVEKHLGKQVRVHGLDSMGAALDKLGTGKKTVRVSLDATPAWIYDRLTAAKARIAPGPDPCQDPKAEKTAIELDGMRAAHRRDGAALCRFLAWIEKEAPKGGVTEISAAATLEAFRREGEHFRGLSFPTISGAGANGAIVHYKVTAKTNKPLKTDSLYLVDSGAQYLDGTTDVTRTVAIGNPTAAMREHVTRVLKGHIALGSARFPRGTTGSQLDILARRALWDAGLDYDHGTGHGVGHFLNVHEGPQRISKAPNTVALKPGMVISNEPGYYKTGAYGIRIENLVAVTPVEQTTGEKDLLAFETLTLAPIDLNLVESKLLSRQEKDWLNAYHERVRKTIAPLVDAKTAHWLKAATRPIN